MFLTVVNDFFVCFVAALPTVAQLALSSSVCILISNELSISPVEFAGNVNVIHEALNVERQVRGVGAHQLLEFLALLVEPHQCPRLGLDIQLVFLPKLLTEVVDQDVVKVLPAEL